MTMKTEIAIKKLNSLIVHPTASGKPNSLVAAALNANMMNLGFIMSENLFDTVKTLSTQRISEIADDVIPVLKKLKGANVKYAPMYPNFPQQVMDADEFELFWNAVLHYWTEGQWSPEYEKATRSIHFENVNFKVIDVSNVESFCNIFTKILSSNDSISQEDKDIVRWFIDNEPDLKYPSSIPFKENLCTVAGIFLEKGNSIDELVKTSTDILRIATHLSGGDISLAQNTKFKSLPRPHRRILIDALKNVITAEDIQRHRNKWNKLFHNLHVFESKKKNPLQRHKLFEIAKKVQNNAKLKTFNSQVQSAIDKEDFVKAVELLMKRPGDFARRLDHLLRVANAKNHIINSFISVADKVSTRVLLQLIGHFKTRTEPSPKKIIFIKGATQKSFLLNKEVQSLPVLLINKAVTGIEKCLIQRFKKLDSIGKVWIDPQLQFCPLPTQQRSASRALNTVARGTHLPVGDKNTLRFFIYWIGQDIDLSASLHDENFKLIEHISYMNLRSAGYEACHSGDRVQAPNGASEFIDITMDKAVARGARYVAMNVNVFRGPTFAEHKACYAGWMTREKPNSNEVYDPKTVEQKIDLGSQATFAIPAVFDLVERKVIWADLTAKSKFHCWGNNVLSNKASTELMLKTIVNTCYNKVTLHDLFTLHAKARGRVVETRDKADVVYSLFDGDITPYHINDINADYLK